MTSAFRLLAFLACFAVSSHLFGGDGTAEQADAQGLRLILKKDWDAALSHYQGAVRAFPG